MCSVPRALSKGGVRDDVVAIVSQDELSQPVAMHPAVLGLGI